MLENVFQLSYFQYVVKKLSNNLYEYYVSDIKKKIIMLPANNNLIALPVIRSSCI